MRRALVFASLAISTTLVRAEDAPPYQPPDFLATTPPIPPALDGKDVWRISLAEARQIAVRHNLDVALERKVVEATGLATGIANGNFEPTVGASYRHSDILSPPASAQEGMASQIFNATDDAWRFSIAQRLYSGTFFSLDFDNARANSSLGTAVQPLNYRSVVTLGITQPLARGFSRDLAIPKFEVLRATIANQRERQQLAISIIQLVERTETAYWNVLQSFYRHDLATRSQKAADDQLALTKRQIDAGTLPSSDLIGAESTVAQRKLELVEAELGIQQASDQLRAVMNLPRDQWSRVILPIDVPRFTTSSTTVDQGIDLALKHRPELAQAKLDIKSSELGTRKADNDRLPQFDLGLNGSLFGQSDTYGGAFSQLSSTDARGWSVFLNFTWAPLRRASTAAFEIAKVQQQQVALRRDQLVQAVWVEVRDAVRNQQGAHRRLVAAARFRDLAEKSLEIEQRRFLASTSTNIAVAQRQDALVAARLAELDALLAHTRAATALHRATGRLLEERHIELK